MEIVATRAPVTPGAARALIATSAHALELLDAALGVARQVNMRQRAHMESQLLPIEQRRVALDHPRLLHVLDPPPARRARQADLVGNFLHGAACVQLQQAQDFL